MESHGSLLTYEGLTVQAEGILGSKVQVLVIGPRRSSVSEAREGAGVLRPREGKLAVYFVLK